MGKRSWIPRVRPTSDKLRELSEHVAYEVEMLIGTATKLLVVERTKDWVDVRAQAESFLIHARQLHDFFYNTPIRILPSHASPVCAADYVVNWEAKRPPKDSVLATLKDEVGKHIAHLTVERVVGKQYEVLTPARALLKVIRAFRDTNPVDFVVDLGNLSPDWCGDPGFTFSGQTAVSTSSPPGDVFVRADVGATAATATADAIPPRVSVGGENH